MKEIIKWETEQLKQYAKTLIRNGFKVYYSKENKPISYLIIEKENKIGYVQTNYFGGLDFSTKHKPNFETGTGFSIKQEVNNPTIENALSTFADFPYWATNKERLSVIKYRGIDEYINTNSWAKYTQLKGGKE